MKWIEIPDFDAAKLSSLLTAAEIYCKQGKRIEGVSTFDLWSERDVARLKARLEGKLIQRASNKITVIKTIREYHKEMLGETLGLREAKEKAESMYEFVEAEND